MVSGKNDPIVVKIGEYLLMSGILTQWFSVDYIQVHYSGISHTFQIKVRSIMVSLLPVIESCCPLSKILYIFGNTINHLERMIRML